MTVLNIAGSVNAGKFLHPLLAARPEIKRERNFNSSNRGLCGGFNSAVIAKAMPQSKNIAPKKKK